MYQILKQAYEHGKVISVYINESDPTRCNVGYVAALNEKEVAMYMLDEDGNFEILSVHDIDKIFRIDADGEYEDKLIKANKLIADKPPEFIYEGGSMIKAVCEYAKKYDYPLWIAFKGNNEIGPWGKAMNVTDDMITITRLGDPKPCNVSYILTRQIDYIACEYKEYHEDEE